jgi:MFS family permease
MKLLSFLDRSHSVANPGYNRWLVPPAALAIHLCIGQIYAYSVFNKPMTQIIGITESAAQDWELTTLGWIFSIALFTLGASAAIFGKWLERVGPRKAMFASALCFSGGFLVASLGVHLHQIWLIYLGHGVIGGIGLGLGYISPVSTLIKWFPDRPGMATGMAIMGFGGGAMIASPLSVSLDEPFPISHLSRGSRNLPRYGRPLLYLYDVWRVYSAGAGRRLEARRMDAQALYRQKPNDHYC